jgi:hypothetical protein
MRLSRSALVNFLTILGLGLVGAGLVWLATPAPATAQCGSQASSCKNCHEVNQNHPVNTSGQWHVDHAFGDFCQFCHGGNVQSNDAAAAHSAMFYPLDDPQLSCAACHPADFGQRAQTYGDVLGVTVGSGTAASGTTGNDQQAVDLAATAIYAPPPLAAQGEAVNLIDYGVRYQRDVLGQQPSPNWKNGLLAGLAVVLTVASGGVLWRFEGLGRTIQELRQAPFLVGDPTAPKPTRPTAIPGLDRPVEERDLDESHEKKGS